MGQKKKKYLDLYKNILILFNNMILNQIFWRNPCLVCTQWMVWIATYWSTSGTHRWRTGSVLELGVSRSESYIFESSCPCPYWGWGWSLKWKYLDLYCLDGSRVKVLEGATPCKKRVRNQPLARIGWGIYNPFFCRWGKKPPPKRKAFLT